MNTTRDIIAELNAYIVENCRKVDTESRYDAMLDECYSDNLTGPFEHLQPSRILKEMSPTDYRCGHVDWLDGEGFVEIDGAYYEQDEVEKEREAFVSTLQDELSELAEDEEENADAISELEALISKVERHSF